MITAICFIITGFLMGMLWTYIGYKIGYSLATKLHQHELIELIEGLPEDAQYEVLVAMNKDIEESKNN